MTKSRPNGRNATTVFVASLSLMMPSFAPIASAQSLPDEVLLCEGLVLPPCADGEPMPVSLADIPPDRRRELIAEVRARDDLTLRDLIVPTDTDALDEAAAAEQAEAEAAAAEQAAAEQIEADAAAAEQAEDDAAAAAEAEAEQAEQAAAEQIEADAAAAEQAEAEAEQAADDAASAEQAETDAAAAEQAAETAVDPETAEGETTIEAETSADTSTPEDGEIAADTSAETASPPDADQAETDAAADPTVGDDAAAESMAAVAVEGAPRGVDTQVIEETITDDNSRSSTEEFETAVTAEDARDEDSGRSNFENALLLGLGAVAVGSILRNGDQVVANTGDRVVVEGENGLTVYKDDDALLRQPGGTIRTETFADGSTRSVLVRENGTQVVTIRDANGRVLRRAQILEDGTQIELFDDLTAAEPVDVARLRSSVVPRGNALSLSSVDRAALAAALAAGPTYDSGRTYSLRQIREISEVRSLVPGIDLDTLTFASGSATIGRDQAGSLVRLGLEMERMLAANPREVFLIEGHTDATGSDSLNLALSDRRAETVALALTEVFAIPPENLVVQGYGESFLKVQTQNAEEANRRATVRRITPLLRTIASN